MTRSEEQLKERIITDLTNLRIPIDEVNLLIRPYSKTYYGRYFPSAKEEVKPRLFIYPYKNTKGDLFSYEEILDTCIHEMVHHIQYTSPGFIRVKGVMHNPNFWKLYNRYSKRAKEFLLKEVS